MKIYIVLAGFLFGFFSFLQAQEPLPSEQKVVIGQNGKLYINKNQGIYLWISSSPDESSQKYRLFSDSSKHYTNPMYLDTEGYNTVRSPSAVDTVSKKMVLPETDIIFEVYSDGKPPVSHANAKGKYKTIKNSRYYTDSVTVEINSDDAGSGVESIHYCVSGTAYAVYREPLKLSEAGEYTISFYAKDKVGNREEPKTLLINLKK